MLVSAIRKTLLLCILLCASVQSMEMTFLAETDNFLHCSIIANSTDTYVWTDISTNTTLFTVKDKIIKTEKAKGNMKYDNFEIFSQFPVATTLQMINTALDDNGTYTCNLLDETSTTETYVVHIEAEPLFIDISCTSSDDCSSPPSGASPSSVMCTCKADGVYPDTLTFSGNDDSSTRTFVTPSLSGPSGSFDISADFDVNPEDSTDNFQCALVGFKGNINTRRTTATYKFHEPHCQLQVTSDETCTIASLNCVCNNAIPDVNLYSFYDERKNLIQEPDTSGVVETDLQEGLVTFYCRGCNGVNYGFNRLVSDHYECSVENSSNIIGLQVASVASVGVALILIVR